MSHSTKATPFGFEPREKDNCLSPLSADDSLKIHKRLS
jgi:hypothetical protein